METEAGQFLGEMQDRENRFRKIFTIEALSNLFTFEQMQKYSDRDWRNLSIDGIDMRIKVVDDYRIFGFPVREAAEELAAHINRRKVYDLCCGAGYLSYALNVVDPTLKIIGVDSYSRSYGFNREQDAATNERKRWHDNIYEMDAVRMMERVNPKDSVLLLSWPDYESPIAQQIYDRMHKSCELIYIGEDQGGCTADDQFFCGKDFEPIIPSWFSWVGIHDRVYSIKK